MGDVVARLAERGAAEQPGPLLTPEVGGLAARITGP